MKNLSMAFAMALASMAYAVTAQTAVKTAKQSTVYIGKNFLPSNIPALIKWDYDLDGFLETLTSPEVNDYITIDWQAMRVTTKYSDDSFKYKKSADGRTIQIMYAGQNLTLFKNDLLQYIGHSIEENQK